MEAKIIVPKFPNGIAIGEERENLAVPVVVDYTAWIEQHGTGALQILLQRPQDTDPYPVTVTNDNGEAVWTPNETDMDFKGRGEIQLVYTAGDVIEKSPVIAVISGRSLGVSGDAPDPYEDWLEQLTELAAETQQNALVAAESAEAAGTSAGAAAVSAGSAAQSALDAEAAKAGAEAAETAAEQSAAAAAEKTAQAAQAAQTAEQSALDAAQSAAEAEQSAGDATTAKTDAETAKTAAETAATAAGVSAGSAAEKAAQAAQSAQTAGQGASAAQQSATDAQAALEAAQLAADAAGTFADDAEESKTAAAQSAALAAQAKTDAETAATDAAASEASAAASAAVAQELIDQIPDIETEIDTKAPAIYKTAGPAAVVTVDDGAEGVTIKTLTVDIPPTQTGSGDPSPENVRPLTARTAVSITRTGESLIGGEALADSIMAGMPAATINRAAQTVTFTGRTNGDNNKTLALIPLVTGQRCTAILSGSGNIRNIRWQYTDGSTDATSALPDWGGAYVSAAGKTVRRLIKVYNSAAETVLSFGMSCILAGVKTAADFQPYTGETVDIDWTEVAGDVYAGKLTISADGSAELAALPHYASYAGETLVGPWVSSMDVYAEGTTPTTGAEVIDLGGSATVYQLTAEQIKALTGVNNIWSNAGDVTVEYPADTKSYVDEQTAALSEEIDTLEAAQPKTVTVTGTVVTITAEDNVRYVCGELSTLTLTPPASGICDVVFTSGTTPTVLTVPSTVRWPAWFDPSALEANTTYEINVQDGLAVVAEWES